MNYVIGIDVGGTTVKFGLFTEKGQMADSRVVPTSSYRDLEELVADMGHQIDRFSRDKKMNRGKISGVGIGLPGPIKDHAKITVGVNIPLKEELDVVTRLNRDLRLPVAVSNDANVAALGEYWQGAGRGFSSLAMFTLGTGVGGGIILNGRIHDGANGAAGELGHLPIIDEDVGRTCACGKKNCLELVCSATGIKAQVANWLKHTDIPSTLRHYNGHYDARAVFFAARNKDYISGKIVEKTAGYLGKACAVVASLYDPELILIGGGVANAGEILLKPTRDYYRDYVFTPMKNTPIRQAKLGNRAGMYGSAKLILDELDKTVKRDLQK